ncbi:MAG: hypothetical protein PGN29_19085 [Gordonia paraffinivorans]
MSQPDYLSFDRDNLADFDQERLDQALADKPELTENHLKIALSLETWADNFEHDVAERPSMEDSDYNRGYREALREVAAHLRQCDYLPGGDMLVIEPRRQN